MKSILKQFFKTILKKSFLVIAFLMAFFVMVGTASIGTFSLNSIIQSSNKIDSDGNATDIIFDKNFGDLNISYFSPNLEPNYVPEISTTRVKAINMNNLDPKTQELVVFPIAPADYLRLSDSSLKNTWNGTPANNKNFLSEEPNYFNSSFISPSGLPMFTENFVYGYNLSMENNVGDIEVFLDPRQFIFSSNSVNEEEILINGLYNNFEKIFSVDLPQSSMIVANPLLSFEPKSLTGNNIRKFGIHRNVMFKSDFSQSNDFWKKNFYLQEVIANFFESMPNITQGDAKPLPDSGIPYIEFQDAVEINLYLNQPSHPLVELYLLQLNEQEQNETLIKKIYMTPFQMSEGLFSTIPDNENDFILFKKNADKYIENFIQNANSELLNNVNFFSQELITNSLENSDWTVTESIQKSHDGNNFLFSSRELNDLNDIVLTAGQSLYRNKKNVQAMHSFSEIILNNQSFNAFYNNLKWFTGFEGMINNEPVFNSVIYDSNKNLTNAEPYIGSISEENPDGVIPTVKKRRLLKDVLKNIIIAFEQVNNDVFLNSLTTEESIGLSSEEINEKINQKKINAITSQPIFFEYSILFTIFQSQKSYQSSLNILTSFATEEAFSTFDQSIGLIHRLDFNNYGVVISSANFKKNSLKIFDQSMIEKAENDISIKIAKNPESAEKIIDDYLKSIPDEYKVNIGERAFFIAGAGDAPDFKAPIISLNNLLPNIEDEAIVFVNATQMSTLRGYWTNNIFLDKIINIKSDTSSLHSVNSKIQEVSDFLNKEFLKVDSEHPFEIYSNTNYISNQNIETLRWTQPTIVIATFSSIILVICLILLLIIIYILIIIIKFLFEILGVSIAISRANGIPRRKIILAISIILASFGLSLVLLVYIGSYFIVPLFFPFISSFWFVPIILPMFPWWGIPVVLLLTVFLISLIVFLISWSTLSKPVLSTLNGNDVTKSNKLSKIIRSTKINFSSLSKLRISMVSTKIGKISLISILMGLSFGISTGAFGLSIKFEESQKNNFNTKNYSYALDFSTPGYQSGLIKTKNYLSAGEIDPKNGIESVLKNSFFEGETANPYYSLLYDENDKVIPNSLLAKRIVVENTSNDNTTFPKTAPIFYSNDIDYAHIPGDPNSTFKTYENIILPSIYVYDKFINFDFMLNFNSIFLAEILDINIGSFFGVEVGNLWRDHVAAKIPYELQTLVTSSINEYRESVLEKYPWYINFLVLDNSSENKVPKIPLELNTDVVFDKNKIRFTDKYLEALGVFLGDEELIQKNMIISYNYLLSEIGDETYTYVNADWFLSEEEKISVKLMGIQENSSHIYLRSSKGENLNNLIALNSNNLIINEGSAYKYNLKIGSKIKIEVKNDYYGSIKNLIELTDEKISFNSKEIELVVAGISTDSVGENFWINQELANNLISLNYGDFVSKILPINSNGVYLERKEFQPILDEGNGNIIKRQFNGVFSKNNQIKLGNYWIPFNSNIGLYPLGFSTREIINYKFNKSDLFETLIALFSVPYDENNLATLEIYGKLENVNSTMEMSEYLRNSFEDSEILISELAKINESNINLSVIGLDGTLITDKIFELININANIGAILTGVIFLPILLVTVMVSMLSLADNFKKTLTILRILGMNKRTTISSIMIIYTPILILGILISFLIVFLTNLFFQSLLFSTLSVYISSSLNLFTQIVSISAMLLLIAVTILFMTIILLKEKFELSIKF